MPSSRSSPAAIYTNAAAFTPRAPSRQQTRPTPQQQEGRGIQRQSSTQHTSTAATPASSVSAPAVNTLPPPSAGREGGGETYVPENLNLVEQLADALAAATPGQPCLVSMGGVGNPTALVSSTYAPALSSPAGPGKPRLYIPWPATKARWLSVE